MFSFYRRRKFCHCDFHCQMRGSGERLDTFEDLLTETAGKSRRDIVFPPNLTVQDIQNKEVCLDNGLVHGLGKLLSPVISKTIEGKLRSIQSVTHRQEKPNKLPVHRSSFSERSSKISEKIRGRLATMMDKVERERPDGEEDYQSQKTDKSKDQGISCDKKNDGSKSKRGNVSNFACTYNVGKLRISQIELRRKCQNLRSMVDRNHRICKEGSEELSEQNKKKATAKRRSIIKTTPGAVHKELSKSLPSLRVTDKNAKAENSSKRVSFDLSCSQPLLYDDDSYLSQEDTELPQHIMFPEMETLSKMKESVKSTSQPNLHSIGRALPSMKRCHLDRRTGVHRPMLALKRSHVRLERNCQGRHYCLM